MTSKDREDGADAVVSFDATVLAARLIPGGDGLPALVVNAVGTDLRAWNPVLRDITPHRQVASWDLRGLHGSGPPRSDALGSGAQAEDGVAVCDHFNLERFAVLAWSTGTRIALEIAHRYPERVSSLVLVCGAYGHPLARALRHLEVVSLLPSITGVAKHFSGYLGGALRAVTSRPEIAGLLRQSGLIGATADVPALVALFRSMAGCDTKTLLATYEAVVGDAASNILEEITSPTLLIAGERDPFTPLRMMEDMARWIPGAHLEIYDEAGHYLPLEYPERLAADIERRLG